MKTAFIREEAIKTIEELSESKLKVALDFLNYLKEKECMEATLEILSSHEIMEQIMDAEKSINEEKFDEFIDWEKIKREV